MSKFILPFVLLLPALSGCAVVDLAAHGVKKYEKSKQPTSETQTSAVAPAPVAVAEDAVQVAEPEPVDAAPASGGAIKAQSLD